MGNTILLRMADGVNYGGMGMDAGMDMGSGITGIAFIDSAINWLMGLPSWMSTTALTAIIILGAIILGWVAGKVYVSIRYPNPEKPQYLSPLQKIMVIAAGAVIVGVLINSFMLTEDPASMVDSGFDGYAGYMDVFPIEPDGEDELTDGEEVDENEEGSEAEISGESQKDSAVIIAPRPGAISPSPGGKTVVAQAVPY